MDLRQYEVSPEKLRWHCNNQGFCFRSTGDLAPLNEFIGQDRAVQAIEFGLSLNRPGYNIFVSGLTGTGKMSVIKAHLEKLIARRLQSEKPDQLFDWCYVQNFASPDRPRVLKLPAGWGRVLRGDMESLLEAIKRGVTRAFSGDQYQNRRKEIAQRVQAVKEKLFRELEKEAKSRGFDITMSPYGVAAVPVDSEGKQLTREEFNALAEKERRKVEERQAEVLHHVQQIADSIKALEKESAQEVNSLDEKLVEYTVEPLFSDLQARYGGMPDVSQYIKDASSFVREQADLLRGQEPEKQAVPLPSVEGMISRERNLDMAFQVNVFVDNSDTESLPLVVEANPNFGNIFGKLERRAFMGTYFSDHTMLKPGALSLSNGGYLILGAREVLMNPGVWEGLKRAIKTKESRLEDPMELAGFIMPVGLRPEPIPIDVKVIMVGDALLYHLLSANDEDFWEMFKIRADFDSQIDRTPEHMDAYAALIANICRNEGLCHLDAGGVAKVIEYGARLVADQNKLSSRFGLIRDVLVEADQWSRSKGKSVTGGEDVKQALEARMFRSDLMAQRMREYMQDGTIMVDTEGSCVGQVNGLSVYDMGDISFGRPSRITARTFAGRMGVINIEREAQLSGNIHHKGVLILAGYLGWRYAQDRPLSLTASLCFEQSYQGVEGDSASSAELYAILSSLADVPLRQDIAVTGSVNQKGELQPIGGVNQKVEGFFDLCRAKGLTGTQGVLIPKQNVRSLMLRDDVVEAVRSGRFHVWAAGCIDEGIEMLTGKQAGKKGRGGRYTRGSVNARVEERLRVLADSLKGQQDKDGK